MTGAGASRRGIDAHGRDRAPVALGGAAFGLAVRLGDGGSGTVPWLVNIGGPWVVLAFAVGWSAAGSWAATAGAASSRSASGAALASVACLLAAVVAKYGLQVVQGQIAVRALIVRLLAWGAAAVVIGATLGTVGARARRAAWWPWVVLGAILAVEAGAYLAGVVHGESAELRYDGQAAATAVLVGELVLGVAFVLVATLVRRRTARTTRRAPA